MAKMIRKFSADEIISMIPVLEAALKAALGVTDVEIIIDTLPTDSGD